jgi:hypothetical protein
MTNEQNSGLPAGIERDSQAHVDWLMKKRLLVIKRWPACPYAIGDIIEYSELIMIHASNGEPVLYPFKSLIECDGNVKEISWYELRTQKQMPGYVKHEGSTVVISTDNMHNGGVSFFEMFDYIPATRLEYEQFLNAGDGTK